MSKNKVQFQKGYSMSAFIADYGTETQCQQALFQWKWPSGFCCPQCGHTQAHPVKTRQLYQLQALSPSNLVDSEHHFCLHKIATDHLVFGDIPADTIKKWDVCFIADASAWCVVLHSLDG